MARGAQVARFTAHIDMLVGDISRLVCLGALGIAQAGCLVQLLIAGRKRSSKGVLDRARGSYGSSSR
eukprot:188906-Pyramimonas_sp.AAC.1